VHALGDPVDAILLREATLLAPLGPAAVLEDQSGALAHGLHELGSDDVRVRCDSLLDEQTVATTVRGLPGVRVLAELDAELLAGVRLVVLRLPKSLAALVELAEAVARWADPGVQLLAGGRVKHMGRGMNEVLARHFDSVRASLGAQKSRVLLATGARRPEHPGYPVIATDPDLGLTVAAHGAAFAGAGVDLGTRLLLGALGPFPPARTAVDLGCGTGILAVAAARALPGASVLALDESRAAVRSAAATAAANGVGDRVEVRRTTLMAGVPDSSVDLVLCNPPFHRGNARDSAVAFEMFAEAARTLTPGGELWTVHNSHLPYLRSLRRLVGRTTVVTQSSAYTVTRSIETGRSTPSPAHPPAEV